VGSNAVSVVFGSILFYFRLNGYNRLRRRHAKRTISAECHDLPHLRPGRALLVYILTSKKGIFKLTNLNNLGILQMQQYADNKLVKMREKARQKKMRALLQKRMVEATLSTIISTTDNMNTASVIRDEISTENTTTIEPMTIIKGRSN
jgi:hypothetical protein